MVGNLPTVTVSAVSFGNYLLAMVGAGKADFR